MRTDKWGEISSNTAHLETSVGYSGKCKPLDGPIVTGNNKVGLRQKQTHRPPPTSLRAVRCSGQRYTGRISASVCIKTSLCNE